LFPNEKEVLLHTGETFKIIEISEKEHEGFKY
jgi:hypothetical protein